MPNILKSRAITLLIKVNVITAMIGGFLGGSHGKASACNEGDPGSIPGSGRSPGEGNGNPLSSTLVWKIPWTEEPDRLQFMGSQRVGHD